MERKKNIFLCSLLALAITLFSFLHFLTYNEARIGYTFTDPILGLFKPIDISWITFTVTYLFAITGIVVASRSLELLTKLIQAYTIMTLLRMICLYLLPLQPPADIIPLHDIFLKASFYSGRDNLKDLFFSGHTATLFLFAFLFPERKWKIVFSIGAGLIGMLVIAQHVHYSIDVIAAPIVSYFTIRILRLLQVQFHKEKQ